MGHLKQMISSGFWSDKRKVIFIQCIIHFGNSLPQDAKTVTGLVVCKGRVDKSVVVERSINGYLL